MNDSLREKFADVEMPRWYRTTAWVIRALAFLVFLVCAWQMTHQDTAWGMAGVFGGVLLMALPSLPKAYIEQRNRIRGLRDGSFKKFLDDERQKNG